MPNTKIKAECIDELGTLAQVPLDFEFVGGEEDVKEQILNELYVWCFQNKKSFDTKNFIVTNWKEIAEKARINHV